MNNKIEKCELSIVIINFRTYDLIRECLKTLIPEISTLDARVVIVDNNSGDGSADLIETWLNDNDTNHLVKLIRSDDNSGFSGGNNTGINAIQANYYLLLNSDTLIRENAIVTLLDTAKNNPQYGLFSPRLEWEDSKPQESCFRFMTPISELIASAGTGIVTNLLKNYVIPISITESVSFPDWTSFACVLIRDQVFKDIGMMDSEFFMYFEDIEFCYRSKKAGWSVMNNPKSRVVHLRGGSSPVKSNRKAKKRLPRYYYESRTRFFYKVYGRWGLIAANLLWVIGRGISKGRETLGLKQQHLCESQWRDIWINWINPLKAYTKP